jgi:hypothetical protein
VSKVIRRAEAEAEGEEPEAQVELPEYEKNSPQGITGLHIVRGMSIPARSRAGGTTKYQILASFEVGDAYVSDKASDVRNAAVAGRTLSKRAKANGEKAPVFVTRTFKDKYALIRES